MVSSRRYYILTAAVLLLAAGWIWLMREKSQTAQSEKISIAHPGFLAPDFSLTSLDDTTVSLSDLHGQPILMNVWASWCLPCRAEMPAIEEIYRDYSQQGLQVVSVNASNQDDLTDVNNFIKQNQLTFPILMDSGGIVSDLYQVRSLPTSFFIDKDGVVTEIIIGEMSEALLRIRVENLLADKVDQ